MSTQKIFLLGFLAICAILGTSLYLQYFDGFMPCPLCTLQRLCFGVIGFMLLLGTLFSRRRFITIPVSLFTVIFSMLGFMFAARQTWLQHFPTAHSNECGVSLQYMLNALPWHQVIGKIFAGNAECTQRSWEFLTLSMPEWAVILFAIFFCVGGVMLIQESKRKSG